VTRVSTFLHDPKDTNSVAGTVSAIGDAVNCIEFGDPNRGSDPSSTDLAGDTSVTDPHNGELINIDGSWVEVELTAEVSTVTCTHNLFLDDPEYSLVSGNINCRWLVFGISHDEQGPMVGPINLTVWYGTGQAISANAIALHFHVNKDTGGSGVITIDASHKMRVTLFFTKAVK
jgi:hypothetical protein